MRRNAISLLVLAGLGLLFLFWRSFHRDPLEPLWKAITFGNTAEVKRLLDNDPSLANKPFRFGRETPLFHAVICTNVQEVVDLLITHGADVNARSGGFELTPLQQAVWTGKPGAVEALLRHKPDVNAMTKDGQTAGT